MNYKLEIDGLRAIAVLSVVLFHINPSILPGGFIGVDIFFVISGYLITSGLNKQIINRDFNFKEFYLKRIKRLLPLFFAVVFFSLFIGYFVLLPVTYKLLSQDAIASNFFLQNFKASISGNYFDSDKIKPLVHFWSLAVEEQFYLIFPILLYFLHKYQNKYKIAILILMSCLSLILAEYMSSTPKFEVYSYFLLPTRFWELLIGCLIALLIPKDIKHRNNIYSICGILIIVLSLFIIDETSTFPGFITILPILGTSLIIIAGNNNFSKILLSNKIFVYLGQISYSMYMWHWPIIIFLKATFLNFEFDILTGSIYFITLIIISHFSKRYIEDYFRFKKTNNKKTIFFYYIIPTIIVCIFSLYIYLSNGFTSRYSIDPKMNVTSTTKCFGLETGCYITENKSDKNKVILLGDSHAEHFSNLFSKWFNENDIPLKLYASGGCNFYSNEFISSGCENIKEDINKELSSTKTIIIGKKYDRVYREDENFLKDYYAYILKLSNNGHNIIIINQVPSFIRTGFLQKWLQSNRYKGNFHDNDYELSNEYEIANKVLYDKLKNLKGVYFLNFNDLIVTPNKIYKYDEYGYPIYYDANHLTAYGSEWLYKNIRKDEEYKWVINLIKETF